MQDRDIEFEKSIGLLLRSGVLLSAAIVLTGGVLFLLRHGSAPAEDHRFLAENRGSLSVEAILEGVLGGESREIIRLGLLALIATPVARVALSLWLFRRERDWLYVAITAFVLCVIGASVLA